MGLHCCFYVLRSNFSKNQKDISWIDENLQFSKTSSKNMESPASPHSAKFTEILKNCPRGRLNYERQSSFSPTKSQEKISPLISQILLETKTSPPSFSSNDPMKNVTTPLAGSLADVSSVLEDVTTEMYDLQVQRLASVIQKIKETQEKARFHENKHEFR